MSNGYTEGLHTVLLDRVELHSTDLPEKEDETSFWEPSNQDDLTDTEIQRLQDEITEDSANNIYGMVLPVSVEFRDKAVQREPWFKELEQELDELLILPDNYDGEGSRAVIPEAIQAAKVLLALLYDQNHVRCTQSGPEPNGGIELVAEDPGGLWEMVFWVSGFDAVEYSIERGQLKRSGTSTVFVASDIANEILGQ